MAAAACTSTACPAASNQRRYYHSRSTCLYYRSSCLQNGCCSVYEHCVSCCLQPEKVLSLTKHVSVLSLELSAERLLQHVRALRLLLPPTREGIIAHQARVCIIARAVCRTAAAACMSTASPAASNQRRYYCSPSTCLYYRSSCLQNGCCSMYEHCVSCCLQPEKVLSLT